MAQANTLIQALEQTGSVYDGMARLTKTATHYRMDDCRDQLARRRHELLISVTSEERLAAHWSGFADTLRAA